MADCDCVGGGLIGCPESIQGTVDLEGDRLRIEFVKVMPGCRREELGSAHAEFQGPSGSTLEGVIGDGNSCAWRPPSPTDHCGGRRRWPR
jgi:hypothetical protein